jgi:hypothetical protein
LKIDLRITGTTALGGLAERRACPSGVMSQLLAERVLAF